MVCCQLTDIVSKVLPIVLKSSTEAQRLKGESVCLGTCSYNEYVAKVGRQHHCFRPATCAGTGTHRAHRGWVPTPYICRARLIKPKTTRSGKGAPGRDISREIYIPGLGRHPGRAVPGPSPLPAPARGPPARPAGHGLLRRALPARPPPRARPPGRRPPGEAPPPAPPRTPPPTSRAPVAGTALVSVAGCIPVVVHFPCS